MLPVALLLACNSDDDARVPDDAECVDACDLALGEPVVCADPGARAALHFDRTTSAATPRIPYMMASSGVVVADLTGDGLLDLFFPHENGDDTQLFVGNGGDEAPARLGGADLVGAVGGSAADIDGDGDLDLFVTRWERHNVLLRNDGTGHFTDVTAAAGFDLYVHYNPAVRLAGELDRGIGWRHQSSSWADVDLDGDLDVYVGGYGIKPAELDYRDPNLPPADPDELWFNDGDGTFTDRSDLVPAEIHDGYTFMSSWFDTDGDAYPELFVWNDFGTSYPSQVLHNDGGAGFSYDVGQSGIDSAFEAMGVGVADLNQDQLPDFALTSYKKVLLVETLDVVRTYAGPRWREPLGRLAVDVTEPSYQIYGWGAEFGDLDHDRDDDLVMGFGYWALFNGPEDKRAQQDGLWLQDEAGMFTDVAELPEWNAWDPLVTRGIVLADIDGNGFLDIVKRTLDSAGQGGPQGVRFDARCDDTAWLVVSLQQGDMNPDAVGARVTAISPDGLQQTRWVTAGSTSMYSSGPPEVHFGLGQDEWVDLSVTWPDGGTSAAVRVPTRRRATLTRQ